MLRERTASAVMVKDMIREFKNYNEAKKYAEKIKNNGLKSYIQEFYDFNGKFYTVLVW